MMDKEKEKDPKETFLEDSVKYYEDVGNRMATLRNSHDISQSEMARRIGVSKSYINKLESGNLKIPVYILKKYCENLSADADFFLQINTKSDGAYMAVIEYKIKEKFPSLSEEMLSGIMSAIKDSDDQHRI